MLGRTFCAAINGSGLWMPKDDLSSGISLVKETNQVLISGFRAVLKNGRLKKDIWLVRPLTHYKIFLKPNQVRFVALMFMRSTRIGLFLVQSSCRRIRTSNTRRGLQRRKQRKWVQIHFFCFVYMLLLTHSQYKHELWLSHIRLLSSKFIPVCLCWKVYSRVKTWLDYRPYVSHNQLLSCLCTHCTD